jgi:hypothetical protein
MRGIMSNGIIYYTANTVEEPIASVVRKFIDVGFPMVSTSLKPIEFGKNIVVNREPGYLTMIIQIVTALENLDTDNVFFCEDDVLYPPSHFFFTPPKDDIYYYNGYVWRWDYPNDRAITYDRLISLSGLCVNRELVLKHYKFRLEKIYQNKWDEDTKHEPDWARKMGYEPGTKKKKRGGITDEDFDIWMSDQSIVDIRHNKTFSKRKVYLKDFKHLPVSWREIKASEIPGWNLKEVFNLWN